MTGKITLLTWYSKMDKESNTNYKQRIGINPFAIDMFSKAMYNGTAMVNGHNTNVWTNTYVFQPNPATYMDASTGLVVRIASSSGYNTDVTVLSTDTPDPSIFQIAPDILAICT
jgi:hypothetical protein